MKKLFTLILSLAVMHSLVAQDSTGTKKKKRDWSKVSLANRANDHFLLQLGYNGWAQKPDTIHTKGLSRSFNIYFMFDFPFKTDPRFSVGIGAGVGTNNVYFDKMTIDITGRNTNSLSFKDVSDTNYFKKYKLATTYLEAPVELRFAANPLAPSKSWKIAIGAKIGTMVSAEVKGKNLLTKDGGTVNAYTLKEKAKRYFNGTRLAATARISYGIIGLYGSYQVSSFVKEGFGPDVRPFQIGITLSGL
jgi:Outer membrane protein beta-barrel domain